MRSRDSSKEPSVNGTMKACQEAIGYLFRREGLLRKALTHSSAKDDQHPSNERLEFLGDAILGMVISEYLFSTLPGRDEGELTKVKSVVVSGESLSRLGLEIGLDRYLLIGKGLRLKREIPRSLIANVVEAIIAAVYLDRGMEAARHFVLDHLHGYVEEVMNDNHDEKNYKSLLQQSAQKIRGQTPTYKVLAERGPDHSKTFRVAAMVGRQDFPAGRGACKKDAEQDAARIALELLKREGKMSSARRGGSRRSAAASGTAQASEATPGPAKKRAPKKRAKKASPKKASAAKSAAKPEESEPKRKPARSRKKKSAAENAPPPKDDAKPDSKSPERPKRRGRRKKAKAASPGRR